MGAWIETPACLPVLNVDAVAPYVGAWIETRGMRYKSVSISSHPMWVRGLKQSDFRKYSLYHCVAPYVGAWIETCKGGAEGENLWSHPMWVRGLKHNDT